MSQPPSSPSLRWRFAQWLEIRWWRNYLSDKSPATYQQQKIDYWQRLMKTLDIKLPPQQQVLEAGCGPAGIFLALADQQITAVDPLLDQYQNDLPHFNTTDYPWVSFKSTPLEDALFDQTFDHVFCLNAINHVNDWERGLDQLTAATRAGGQLLLGIDVHNNKGLKFVFQSIPGDVLHPHQHDRDDYRQALLQRGWIIKREHTWKKGVIFDYWLLVLQKNIPHV